MGDGDEDKDEDKDEGDEDALKKICTFIFFSIFSTKWFWWI